MTISPTKLRRIINQWQKRLKIEHIDIGINLEEQPDDPDALASVEPSDLYDYAEIRFRHDWQLHSAEQLNRIIVHELLHVMFRDYGQAVRAVGVSGALSMDVRLLWHDRCHDTEEALIDRLACRFVELAGVIQ